jgi:hypothetical protein
LNEWKWGESQTETIFLEDLLIYFKFLEFWSSAYKHLRFTQNPKNILETSAVLRPYGQWCTGGPWQPSKTGPLH